MAGEGQPYIILYIISGGDLPKHEHSMALKMK